VGSKLVAQHGVCAGPASVMGCCCEGRTRLQPLGQVQGREWGDGGKGEGGGVTHANATYAANGAAAADRNRVVKGAVCITPLP
jgi:hypothetical protein